MLTDPIADMLTRIRNATRITKSTVTMPSSQLKERIAKILLAEGFIDGFEAKPANPGRSLSITLRYDDQERPAIVGIKRVSKPGHRVYRRADQLDRVQGGIGMSVVSTSQGLMPDREARRRRLGGEVICEVW